MEYIIFDLEWNNAYNYKINKGMNEIIEIGALKLNEKLDITDTYKQLIKPRLSKRLRSSFKNLTHITMEEIREKGVDFDEAFAGFSRWCGNGDLIFLSWSTSDLHTLAENYLKFTGSADVKFIKKYADAQKYCMHFLKTESNNQVSLSKCAESFGIVVENESLHRALEDCYVTALCFKKVFDSSLFEQYVSPCSREFFERLVFKPFFIDKPKFEDFCLYEIPFVCKYCGKEITRIKPYELVSNSFKSVGKCSCCNKKYWLNVRAKKTYDGIVVSTKAFEMNKKRAKKFDG